MNDRELLEKVLPALEKITQFAEAQICMHEETHRGGVLWEICSQCGAKWADDEGGKPEFEWPKEADAARAMMDTIRAHIVGGIVSASEAPNSENAPSFCDFYADAITPTGRMESHFQ